MCRCTRAVGCVVLCRLSTRLDSCYCHVLHGTGRRDGRAGDTRWSCSPVMLTSGLSAHLTPTPWSSVSYWQATAWSSTFTPPHMTLVEHWMWCTRDDLPTPVVDVIDVALSDHYLLLWSTSLLRLPPAYVTSSRQPWTSFDHDIFRADLLTSALCDKQQWSAIDGDGVVKLYDDIIAALLDRQVPHKTVTYRPRPSNVWYDDECRRERSSLRLLERSVRRTGALSDSTQPAVTAWRTERKRYFELLRRKRSEYWTTHVDSERLQPRRLWQSFEQLLGRGKAPTTADIESTHLSCTVSPTIKLLTFVTPQQELPLHSSPRHLSAASSGSFILSCRQMLSNWSKNFQTNSDPQILWKCGYWNFTQQIWRHFSAGFCLGLCSMKLFYRG